MTNREVGSYEKLSPFVRRFIKEMQHTIHAERMGAYEAFMKVCERRRLDPFSNIALTISERIYDADPIFDIHD